MNRNMTYWGRMKPKNPQLGDYFILSNGTPQYFDGNEWNNIEIETKEQRLERELQDLKDFISYKGITNGELDEFITSRRLVERMQYVE